MTHKRKAPSRGKVGRLRRVNVQVFRRPGGWAPVIRIRRRRRFNGASEFATFGLYPEEFPIQPTAAKALEFGEAKAKELKGGVS